MTNTKTLLATAALAILPLFAIATPAFAMKGIDAARSCEAQKPKCVAIFDDAGGVTIFIDGTMIDCPSPQGECGVVPRVHGKGDFGPVGSLSSPMGQFSDGGTGGGGGKGGRGKDNVGSFSTTLMTEEKSGPIIQ